MAGPTSHWACVYERGPQSPVAAGMPLTAARSYRECRALASWPIRKDPFACLFYEGSTPRFSRYRYSINTKVTMSDDYSEKREEARFYLCSGNIKRET